MLSALRLGPRVAQSAAAPDPLRESGFTHMSWTGRPMTGQSGRPPAQARSCPCPAASN